MIAMTPKEFEEQMKQLVSGDAEAQHVLADSLMCNILVALGYKKGVEIFDSMDKWYA